MESFLRHFLNVVKGLFCCNIFLDSSSLLKEHDKDFEKGILDESGLFADNGTDDIIDESTITVLDSNKPWMHDLTEQMGREIVWLESTKDPERRSRL